LRPSNRKKTAACIAGRSAPPEKPMGHAEAVIMGETGTAENKIKPSENASAKAAELLTKAIDT
jgi:succinyl-CoA synthetase alpha subunit